jgi:hypothetical protein
MHQVKDIEPQLEKDEVKTVLNAHTAPHIFMFFRNYGLSYPIILAISRNMGYQSLQHLL